MAASIEFTEYLLEQLETLSTLESKPFFGGMGISHDGVQFAMVMENSLYLVVDDSSRDKYIRAGKKPFSYMTKNGLVNVRRYYEVPEDLLEDQEQLIRWAKESIAIAKKPK